MSKRTNIFVLIESEINTALKIMAAKKGINKSDLIVSVIAEYVKDNYKP